MHFSNCQKPHVYVFALVRIFFKNDRFQIFFLKNKYFSRNFWRKKPDPIFKCQHSSSSPTFATLPQMMNEEQISSNRTN